ncbi:Thiamine-phosphate synthase [compost metagenome]
MQILKEKSIDLPVLAVGGITLSDVDPLMATGIFGIAVSASINQAEDMRAAYLDFYDQLK